MLDMLKEKLSGLGVYGWELTETRTRGWEFYFIGHRLDQNRAKDIVDYRAKVYVATEGGKYLGAASALISPTASEADVDRILADIKFQAGLMKDPAYTLTSLPITVPEKRESVDVEAIAESFMRALSSLPETETEYINSYEIFVNELTRHTLNSNGVEYTCIFPSSMAEVVVNARAGDHEIELYRAFRSGTCDGENLRSELARALQFGRDRLIAQPTPILDKPDVVLSTDDAVEIYSYFLDKTFARFKLMGMTDWEAGKPICPEFKGDRISVRALSSLRNSDRDFPVDAEGSVIEDRDLIKDGVVQCFWGSRQFASYLGLEKSSAVPNVRYYGGTKSAEELRQGDFLELVEFSDFQVDPMGGTVAGEIRLGYLHQGGRVTVVTGGSLSGSLTEAIPTMEFSKEEKQYNNNVIPAVTRLKGLTVTGIR